QHIVDGAAIVIRGHASIAARRISRCETHAQRRSRNPPPPPPPPPKPPRPRGGPPRPPRLNPPPPRPPGPPRSGGRSARSAGPPCWATYSGVGSTMTRRLSPSPSEWVLTDSCSASVRCT